jgi:hypothetical protein
MKDVGSTLSRFVVAPHACLPLAKFQAHDVLGMSELLVQAWKALRKVK